MIKFRLYYDKDKETEWLNEMAKQGYAMTHFFAGFYTFEECTPGEYIYQIDFGDKLFYISQEYHNFMEEIGVEIVQTWGFAIILRKKASEGDFVLYTDVDSRIEHYTKIRTIFKICIAIELVCFMIEIFASIYGSPTLLFFCFLIAVIIVAMLQAVIKTNQIIAELKERKGEVSQCNNRFRRSPVLVAGLLFNACALAIQNPALEPFKLVIQIAAIALMVIGLYQIATGQNEK